MITLTDKVAAEIKKELESIPEKYQKPFNSNHEGYAVLLEEVEELKNEIFFGEKRTKSFTEITMRRDGFYANKPELIDAAANVAHKKNIRDEAVQVAAMAIRIIQELT